MSMREYSVKERPRMRPTHPGEIVREDVLPALGLSVSEAARLLRVSRQTLHRLLAGTIGVSPEMAVRLGKLCGNGPGLWIRMQAEYDLWKAERRMAREIERIPTRRVVNG
jgi:addiction module HigA family antidote